MSMAPEDGTLSILRRLGEAERNGVSIRIAEVTATSPLTVAVGGDTDNPWAGVKALASAGRLDVADVVACLVAQNDVLVLGRLGGGGGYQSSGPVGTMTTAASAFTALTSGPSITVREAGVYDVEFLAQMQQVASGAVSYMEMALRVNGTEQGTAAVGRGYLVTQVVNDGAVLSSKLPALTLAAGDVLTLAFRNVNALNSAYTGGTISIRPAR